MLPHPDRYLRVHLDPCLLPDADDEERWSVFRQWGYCGPADSRCHPAEMPSYALTGRAALERADELDASHGAHECGRSAAGGDRGACGWQESELDPRFARLCRLVALLVLATPAQVSCIKRGEAVSLWRAPEEDGSVLLRGGAPSTSAEPPGGGLSARERWQLEKQTVGVVLRMILDLNLALLEQPRPPLFAGSIDARSVDGCAALRHAEQASLLAWRHAIDTKLGVGLLCPRRVRMRELTDKLSDQWLPTPTPAPICM